MSEAVLDEDATHVIKNSIINIIYILLLFIPIIFNKEIMQAIAVSETKPIELEFLKIPVKDKSWKPFNSIDIIINKKCIKI